MPCQTVILPGGGRAILCFDRGRASKCSVEGCDQPADYACDFPDPSRRSGTCDANLCEAHAVSKGPDLDWCPHHEGDPPPRQTEMLL